MPPTASSPASGRQTPSHLASQPAAKRRTAAARFSRLRAHQQRAVNALWPELSAEGTRATCVLPCGAGKTHVGAEISALASALSPGPSVVVVPTLQLIGQTVAVWARHRGKDLGRVIAVCSDDEVLQLSGLVGGRARVTSSAAELAAFCLRGGPVAIAITYHSLPVLETALARHGCPVPSLAVIDEAHRTAGSDDKLWASVHYDDELPFARRLYLTATPRVLAGERVLSMNDTGLYGTVAYRMTIAEGVRDNILAPYRLVVPLVTDEAVHTLLGGRSPAAPRTDSTLAARHVALQLAVLRAAHQFGVTNLLTYHSRVAEARRFADTLPEALDLLDPHERPKRLWARHAHANQERAVVDEALKELDRQGDGTLRVLSNVRLFNEGMDSGSVNGVALFHSMGPIPAIQALGRALRRGDPRVPKTATFMLPVLLGPGQDPAQALDSSEFAGLWNTLQAIASMDEDVAAGMESARRAAGRGEASEAGARELMPWLHVTGLPGRDLGVLARTIAVRAVEMTTSTWQEGFGAAQAYYQEFGNLLVRGSYLTPAGLKLGQWISNQRSRRRRGELTGEQIRLLDGIGIVWSVQQYRLQLLITHLRIHAAKHGHLDVAQDCEQTGPDGIPYKIGDRVGTQRQARRNGTLDEATIRLLDAEGFVWERTEEQWALFLADLDRHKRTFGHLNVARSFVVDDRKVGRRVTDIRLAPDSLTTRQRTQLDQRGFVWDARQWAWNTRAAMVRDLSRAQGGLDFPEGLRVEKPVPLSPRKWLRRQVDAADTLTPQQIRTLVDLGVDLPERTRARAAPPTGFQQTADGALPPALTRAVSRPAQPVPFVAQLLFQAPAFPDLASGQHSTARPAVSAVSFLAPDLPPHDQDHQE
nr:DEAD/DEAH box helicase [Kitasatospora purpeofusca]